VTLSEVFNSIPTKGVVQWPQIRMILVGALIFGAAITAVEARFAIHNIHPHEGVSDSLRVILERQVTVINNQQKLIDIVTSLRDAVVASHGPLSKGP